MALYDLATVNAAAFEGLTSLELLCVRRAATGILCRRDANRTASPQCHPVLI